MAIPPKHKWELLQFFINPNAMNEEMLDLFKWYYENVYRSEIATVEKAVSKCEKDLEDKLRKYGMEYFELLTKTDYSKLNSTGRLSICISYYYETGEISGYSNDNNIEYFMFGYKYP